MRYRNRFRYRQRRHGYGGCVAWMLVMAFLLVLAGAHSDSGLFFPLLFVVLAFIALIGSFLRFNPNRIYGGVLAFIWLMSFAFCSLIGSYWPWLVIPIILSVLLSILRGPLLAALLGLGVFSLLNRNQNVQTIYTPPMQSYAPPYQPQKPQQFQQSQPSQYYQPYGEGYQQAAGGQTLGQQDGTNNQAHPSEQHYDQPQSHYSQELPPQQ